MIANSRQSLDQHGHARQSPQVGLVSLGRRTGQQRLRHPVGLLPGKFGFRPRRPLAGQGAFPALFPRLLPAIRNLARHSKTARHLRGRTPFLEQRGGAFPARFQLSMISCLRHARTIDLWTPPVTNKCHPITRVSIIVINTGEKSFLFARAIRRYSDDSRATAPRSLVYGRAGCSSPCFSMSRAGNSPKAELQQVRRVLDTGGGLTKTDRSYG